MNHLQDLYQQVILDHNRSPHNFGTLETATHHGEGYNPLCGDHYHVHLVIEDNRIADIRFEGEGCAISKASASLMTGALKGATPDEARDMAARFRAMITDDVSADADASLGKLRVLAGVREFPMRVKCAALAWHTLVSALDQNTEAVGSE